MLIIGERINSSNRRIARAIEERDSAFIQQEAQMQVEAGADYIDVNAGTFLDREVECLQWLVETVQQAVDKPLCLDSPNPEALAAALKVHRGKALVNSITAQKERYNAILPLLKEYECGAVVLLMDDSGIPATAEEKVNLASKIIADLTTEGIAEHNIYVDPLIQPISTDFIHGAIVLDTIEKITQGFPDAHTLCGISNISFGLPCRGLLNQIFTVLAMQRGLDSALLDPCDQRLMANIAAASTLLGGDEFCINYIDAYRKGRLEV